MIDKNTGNWQNLPIWLKCWFFFNFLDFHPARAVTKRIETITHVSGFLFCLVGLVNEAALAGGLIMLTNAYLFHLATWQGDKYGIWYEPV